MRTAIDAPGGWTRATQLSFLLSVVCRRRRGVALGARANPVAAALADASERFGRGEDGRAPRDGRPVGGRGGGAGVQYHARTAEPVPARSLAAARQRQPRSAHAADDAQAQGGVHRREAAREDIVATIDEMTDDLRGDARLLARRGDVGGDARPSTFQASSPRSPRPSGYGGARRRGRRRRPPSSTSAVRWRSSGRYATSSRTRRATAARRGWKRSRPGRRGDDRRSKTRGPACPPIRSRRPSSPSCAWSRRAAPRPAAGSWPRHRAQHRQRARRRPRPRQSPAGRPQGGNPPARAAIGVKQPFSPARRETA